MSTILLLPRDHVDFKRPADGIDMLVNRHVARVLDRCFTILRETDDLRDVPLGKTSLLLKRGQPGGEAEVVLDFGY